MIDIVSKYNRVKKIEDELQARYHVWPEGSGGCSQIEKCPTSRSQQLAGIKFPPKIIKEGWHGITKERGGMRTGNMIHEDVGLALEIDFLNYRDTDPEYKDLEYITEVYVIVPITSRYTAISPIDVMYYKKGAIEKQMIHFKDFSEEMWVVVDPSKVVKIIDIKSGGDFNYYMHLVDGKIPNDYMAQFHVYMEGAGKKVLTVLAFHKQYGRLKTIEVVWNDAFRRQMTQIQERVDMLTKKYKEGKKVNLTKADLSCLWENGNIDWYSCPMSVTYEEMGGRVAGKPSLHLLKPCPAACKIIKRKAKAQFVNLSKWKRGKAHVRIMKGVGEVKTDDLVSYLNIINKKRKKAAEKNNTDYIPLRPHKGFKIGEYIMSKNKSGTNYVDTIYDAFTKYKEMDNEKT